MKAKRSGHRTLSQGGTVQNGVDIMTWNKRGLFSVCVLSVISIISCSSTSSVTKVVRGFFEEINRSNFETAKAKYLSAKLINTLDSPVAKAVGVGHKSVREYFGVWAGSIDSIDVTNVQVTGEQAAATVSLTAPWGTRGAGNVQLIKESGRDWKISDWGGFNAIGAGELKRGWELCRDRQLDAALAEFQNAYNLNPRDVFVPMKIGLCYQQMGDLNKAREYLEKAVSMYPDKLWNAYVHLGDVYSSQGDVADAERAYQKAIKNKSDYPDAYNSLAWLYAEHAIKLDEAVELAQKGVSLSPDNPQFLDTLGWTYYKQGNRDQALKYLAPAASKAPSNQEIQNHYRQVRGAN
jgi:Flp pilus assembly protein TadD